MKEFHSALSDTVREYLEAAFHTPALERTTAEILRQLRKRQDLASDRQLLVQELLEHCDLVKFAKFRPEAAEALQIHAAAVRFVKETQKPHESR